MVLAYLDKIWRILLKKGNDVTILARNKTYENLKNNGLIIKHKFEKKTVDYFNVIEKLDKNDILFIVSRFSSLDNLVPNIENNKSKNIVFVGNNISVEKYMNKMYYSHFLWLLIKNMKGI